MMRLALLLTLALLLLACGPEAPTPSPGKVDATAVPADARAEASPVADSGLPASDAGAPGQASHVTRRPGELVGTNDHDAVVTSRAWCVPGELFLGVECDASRGPSLVLVRQGQVGQSGFCTWRNDAPAYPSDPEQRYGVPQAGIAWVTCLEGPR